jgi:hypothetical protein
MIERTTMIRPRLTRYAVLFVWIASSWGCTALTLSPVEPASTSAPFLLADSSDLIALQAMGQKHDGLLQNCGKAKGCEELHYTRGLIALFESGSAATSHFTEVIASAPSSPFAASSARWIHLLETGLSSSSREYALRAELSYQVLNQLLDAEASSPQMTSPRAASRPSAPLQQRVKDQEKKIAELTMQLNLLKHIEQGRLGGR